MSNGPAANPGKLLDNEIADYLHDLASDSEMTTDAVASLVNSRFGLPPEHQIKGGDVLEYRLAYWGSEQMIRRRHPPQHRGPARSASAPRSSRKTEEERAFDIAAERLNVTPYRGPVDYGRVNAALRIAGEAEIPWEPRAPEAREQATRTCLRCRKPFSSEWVGRRMCEICRKRQE